MHASHLAGEAGLRMLVWHCFGGKSPNLWPEPAGPSFPFFPHSPSFILGTLGCSLVGLWLPRLLSVSGPESGA